MRARAGGLGRRHPRLQLVRALRRVRVARSGRDVARLELTSWAQSFLDYGVRYGTFRARATGFPPRPGDAVVFNLDPSNRNGRLIDHVGIVTGVSGGTLYTIEGNTGKPNGVYRKSYPSYVSMTSIVGFTTAVGLSGV